MSGRLSLPIAALAIGLAGTPAPGAGAPGARSSENSEMLLSGGPIVVTAAKREQRVEDSPSSVTVITEEQIARSAAMTIPDLLRSVPGVDVMEANSSQQYLSMRGFNDRYGSKLLVMVDGRSVYQDVYGAVTWNFTPIPMERIKRIEIVRGAGSALYGANAFSGVVNILLKTPEEMARKGKRMTMGAAGGEHGGQQYNTTVHDTVGRGWSYALGSGYGRSSGLGERRRNVPRDSYTAPTLTADVQKRDRTGSWLLSLGAADATADWSSAFSVQDAVWRNRFAALSYTQDNARNPLLFRAYGNFLFLADGAHPYDATSNAYTADIQQQHALGPQHTLVYGASYRQVNALTQVSGTGWHHQGMWDLFLQDEFHPTPNTIVYTGLRADSNSAYGANYSPRVNLVHHLGQHNVLRASYGTAFRAPTLLDSYYDYSFTVGGGLTAHMVSDPNLKPEKVDSFELGYRHSFRKGYVELSYFDNHAKDLIGWRASQFAPPPIFAPTLLMRSNMADARSTGIEVDTRFPLSPTAQGVFNYSFQDVAYLDGSPVDFSPRNKANIGFEIEEPSGLFGSCMAHFVDSSACRLDGRAYGIPSYMRLDARIGWRLGQGAHGWRVSVAGTDLLNDGYREFPNVVTPSMGGRESAQHARTLWLTLNGRL